LGSESSLVTLPRPRAYQIDGGATRGTNLFHSFSEFSVPTGGSASFNNAPNIQNIMTRVTGGSVSSIDGLIRANGTANLFLINPNGIIFGANAQLNINGSFIGSTASSVLFADGTEFSATDTRTQPLLTVNVPIGLQLGDNPATVKVHGSNLEVRPNQNLVLVGGDVSLDKGKLTAPGGRIELGGLSTAGKVGLNENGSLNFPNNVARADVSLTNGAFINVRAGGGGFITINARNLEVSRGSKLIAGIGKDLGTSGVQAGDVEINASDRVSLDRSNVENQVDKNAQGNAGNIKIITGSLFLTNKAELNTGTWGVGNSGQVIIKASDRISLIDSQLQSRVNEKAVGNSGGIDITTGSLFLKHSGLSATTDGTGNSGPVIINASGSILMERSDLRSRVAKDGNGNSGGIYITADSLSLTKHTELNAGTWGVGNSGEVILKASDSISLIDSQLQNRVNEKAVGNSGGIDITTGSLFLKHSGLSATTDSRGNSGSVIINASGSILMERSDLRSRVAKDGKGNSGGIYITADSLSLTKHTELNAGTWGVGNSGEVILKASSSISLRDGSTVRSRVYENAMGNSGGIDITTGNLSINKSGLTATTEGTGNAGPVIINASGSISMNGGYVSSRVAEKGVGNSGGLYITADSLSLTNKAELNASTWGVGNSGSVIIKASDRISLRDGSFISSRVTDSGKGNSSGIYITADSLSLTNNAELNVSSFGQGNPGNLVITADSIRLENQGKLTAQTLSGEGGNIVLQVEDILLLRDNSLISAQASGDAKGGNINIDAGFIIAFPNQNNDIIASAQRGNGGNINITTQAIFGLEERSSTPHNTTNDIDASSEFGLNGNVSINTPDVDPSRGLVNLPVEPVNVEVTEGCQGDGKQASVEFFNTGRGGLAPNPYEPLSSSNIWEDVPHPTQRTENSASAAKASASPATPSNKIVEAQGWHINDKGEVVLVAQMPATRSQNRCRLR
jgi:filamentous hemagglutinin family protein